MDRQPNDSPGTPGRDPAEGRSDLDLPGADQPDLVNERQPGDPGPDDLPGPGDLPIPGEGPQPDRVPPDGPDTDRPLELGERVANGPGAGMRAGEPDLVPDVEVPEETM